MKPYHTVADYVFFCDRPDISYLSLNEIFAPPCDPNFTANISNIPPATLKWKWREDELPFVDQYNYTCLGVDLPKYCFRDAYVAYISTIIGKAKTHVGKMDAILLDSLAP